MLTRALQEHLEAKVGAEITDIRPISGGDINVALVFHAGKSVYFIKLQNQTVGTNMFRTEEMGLNTIRDTQTIKAPEVFLTGNIQGQSFLLMEYISFHTATTADWQQLGRNLARLHQTVVENFGLDHNNYIGTLPQINTQANKWSEFYAQSRIQPQIDLAEELLSTADMRNWEKLQQELDSLLNEEEPSLIHGDLWSGNVRMSSTGPVIFDPAICYANREMDLAMSMLFGGFPQEFYKSYAEEYPLVAKGYEDRIQVYQLYYLLVHVNLFGSSYVRSASSILKKFI